MTRTARIIAYGSAGSLVLVGVACAIVFSATLGQVLALVLIGLGLVLATSLVFLEVGLSEDRQLAREEAERERAAREARGERRQRPLRRRLDRMRGRPRRLS